MVPARSARWFPLALLALAVMASAQPPIRRATTISALRVYPVFYHGERVVVHSRLTADAQLTWLQSGDLKVLCLRCPAPDRPDLYEAAGTFWDAGRLETGDPRLPGEVSEISERLFSKPWPAAGELLVLAADQVAPAERPAAPSIRAIALEPERYLDQRVTLTGRFRGRNLYGDLPDTPRQSRWDFVLQSADAAIWVTDLRPQGRAFSLDVNARVDTSRWLEVAGIVSHARGLVWMKGAQVALAKPPAEDPVRTALPAPPPQPAPEVIFSAPTQDDTEVRRDTNVRIQFSRAMDPRSFRDRVRVAYVQSPLPEGQEEAEGTPIQFATSYQEGNRVLEIRFAQPLEPYRLVRVEISDEVAARDGRPMAKSWALQFMLGGT